MIITSKDNLTINNQYKIIDNKEKGSGGFSLVYLAEKISDKKQYAIKVLKESSPNFEKEISIHQKVSSLNHPNIVNLVDSGEDFFKNEKKQYAVLEFASNGELFDFIKKTEHGLKERYAKFIFRKILQGVQAFHKIGICHRDLKLQNILLDDIFNPKICDFGFATEIKGEDGSGKLYKALGTENYTAPEMLLMRAYNGIQVDIFSLGVILLNLVSGKIGFLTASFKDPYYRYIMTHHYNLYWDAVRSQIGELSDELKALYLKMVSFCPEKRPSIDKILKDPWMKEINDLNEIEYKNLEKEVYQEFLKIMNKT